MKSTSKASRSCFHFQRRCQKFSNGLFPRWTCEIKATCLTFRCDCEIHKSEDQRLTGLGSEHFFTHICVFPASFCFEFTFKFYFSIRVITLKNFKNVLLDGVANEKAVKAQLFFCFFGPTVVRIFLSVHPAACRLLSAASPRRTNTPSENHDRLYYSVICLNHKSQVVVFLFAYFTHRPNGSR